MTLYLLASASVFAVLALIWNKSDWLNLGVKAIFCVLAMAGTILFLMDLGFVVKG